MPLSIELPFFLILAGGLGLFLYGMRIMSESMQNVAGEHLRRIVARLTRNRFSAVFFGSVITAILQSSSATTVMVVGFVNAGLLPLVQGIAVVLGANIGTTITAQLIAFPITTYALPLIGLGTCFSYFLQRRNQNDWGEILLGFGLVLLGLAVMKQSFDPVKHTTELRQIIAFIGNFHLLGILVGALLTVLLQSGTATIALVLALATTGIIGFETSLSLVLGENIGATITSNLAAIGSNLAARRTAFCHFLFNILGAGLVLLFFQLFSQIVAAFTPGDADMVIQSVEQAQQLGMDIGEKPFIARHIANTHTLFNLFNVLVFLTFIGTLARISTRIIRGHDKRPKMQIQFIDNRVINTPPVAMNQAWRECLRMAQTALEMLRVTNHFLKTEQAGKYQELHQREELLDYLQKEITNFLVAISQQAVSAPIARRLAVLMYMVNDLEKIGDHCENLWVLERKKAETRTIFSLIGKNELADISEKTESFLCELIEALQTKNHAFVRTALHYENDIDLLEENYRNHHIERLNTGECSVGPGMIFIDMLHNYEKISDHTLHIAKAVLESEQSV